MDLDASGDNVLQQKGSQVTTYRHIAKLVLLLAWRHVAKMRDNYTNAGQHVTGGPATSQLSLVLLLQLKNSLWAKFLVRFLLDLEL